ncbi:hypothetical protein QE152_g25279 [Popillia japonica]|uniref:Uncharacterized protein n=1 Tax=Popillia japonica TaxID=7064 RepID=A0AAW1K2J5_POPJA
MNQVTEQLFTDHYKRDFAYLLQETQNELEMDIEYLRTDFTSSNSSNDIIFSSSPADFNVDSTESILPIIDCKFVLLYKPEKISSTKDIFIITFTGTMWMIFFCILVIAIVAFRICTKHYHIVYQDHFLWTWVDITFWAIAASCQQGVSYAPYKFASCLIFLLVYMLAYLLYTVFTARITSTLLQETSVSIATDTTKLKFVTLNLTNMTESN